MNHKQKLTAFVLAMSLSAGGSSPAFASAPASQFGFSGWPYRQSSGCTTPTKEPVCTPEPSPAPTYAPTYAPTHAPVCTPEPTATPAPTAVPTPEPTIQATAAPSVQPTREPSPVPTAAPTAKPTPTKAPQATQKPAETTPPPSNDDDYTTPSITAQEENAFLLLNQDRIANDRPALTLDPVLCEIARLKSRDMYEQNYFAHTSPTYGSASDMLKAFGYSFTSVGENIAHHATVEKAQAAFMSSAGHRRNILGTQWSKVGIGVWTDAQGFVYVTQLFVR